MRAAVLVEGRSDSAALERLAARRGRDLTAEGVTVVAMGGATNIRRYLERLGPRGLGLDLAGLCDAAEVGYYRRGLAAAGLGADLTRAQMEQCGFFVCVADLEDELIRALGTDAVEAVIDERGELGSFRTMQQQPAQRDRPLDAQLRRFLGTRGGRKIAYAPALIDALDLGRVPAPLDGVLGAV
ncbi:TOPRIM nucleotidyl transferase/hydrolase domain-containing protein [Occultella gossypii]|uniref:ATP-dependent endonuclease n=1 Tax=Occultella gossypii TaxID=2800820 RepID=A0ABS7SGE4_9MICO|nr:TOPRIM nucleotidyl transferase/hydrolase domain-containing protein [Occultella gossypii]MBZ2198323.1 ATP-dependent endonuclease [Occultella gossypii]